MHGSMNIKKQNFCVSNENQRSYVPGKYTISMMIKVKFGIGVYNTIFSEDLLEKEQANFLLIQKYLSLVHVLENFMEAAMKNQRRLKWQTTFPKKKNQ